MNAYGLLLAASLVAGPVSAPQRVEVEVGWINKFQVDNPTKTPTLLVNLFDSQFALIREYSDDPAAMRFAVVGRTPGEYVLVLVSVDNGRPVEASRVLVVVKGPPGPPSPPVPPPAPVNDPLLERLKPIFGADVSPVKARDAAQLAAVYRQAVTTADNAQLTTLGQLYDVVRQAARAVVPPPALDPVRQVVAEELVAKLGSANVTLDAATRSACKTQFARVAAVLEALK